MQIAPCDRSGIYELIEIRIIKFGVYLNFWEVLQVIWKRKIRKRLYPYPLHWARDRHWAGPAAQLCGWQGDVEGALREGATQRGKQIGPKPFPLNLTGGPARSPLPLTGGPPASWRGGRPLPPARGRAGEAERTPALVRR